VGSFSRKPTREEGALDWSTLRVPQRKGKKANQKKKNAPPPLQKEVEKRRLCWQVKNRPTGTYGGGEELFGKEKGGRVISAFRQKGKRGKGGREEVALLRQKGPRHELPPEGLAKRKRALSEEALPGGEGEEGEKRTRCCMG